MDTLKFKLKFGLRPYFFYFSLPLIKTLSSDSLFLTLFYLNIHSLFIFLLFSLIFHNSQNTFLPYFPPTHSLSLSCRCISPPFSFFFPCFSPSPTYPPSLSSFYFSPTSSSPKMESEDIESTSSILGGSDQLNPIT